ncbi:hypothetical protein BDZ90DRAFT_233853 [Jaminaea rosea]|uniref:Uncharacterized protein n=1 Tax=Jaminaea rosea TaxID=1569628 RepID=A0A316UKS5_9BASI|nr:hypothetical protein BDZ90DRAFT_233853 [Jaminaea rosea]PWN25839.1 hypothetical protein BDZ90DRAFT_233853 [Jaminaea rosea]
MLDPTASKPSRRPWLPLLQPLILLSCFFLTLIVFSCPDPLSPSSGITLLTVRPYNISAAAASSSDLDGSGNKTSSAGSTITFGGANATATTLPANATEPTALATSSSSENSVTASAASTPTVDPSSANNRTLAAQTSIAAPAQAASTQPQGQTADKRSSHVNEPRAEIQPLMSNSTTSRGPTLVSFERVPESNGTNESNSPLASPFTPSTPLLTGEALSLIELKISPLGSCFRTWSGARSCTPASLRPTYDSSHLTMKALGGYDTKGLPSTIKTTPILLVVVVSLLGSLSLSSTLGASLRVWPGATFGQPLLQGGAAQRAWASTQRVALWLRLGVALLLLGTAVSMRLVVSKAAYAFNASNAARTLNTAYLTPEAMALPGAGQQVGLQAVTGRAFGLLWASVVLLLAEFWWERRRLRMEQAIAVARADLEAAWGRDAAVAMNNLGRDDVKRQKSTKIVNMPPKQDEETWSDDGYEQSSEAAKQQQPGFFWPATTTPHAPPYVARKAVPSYKGGLAPVLGPLFKPAPAAARAMDLKLRGATAADGQGGGAVYYIQGNAPCAAPAQRVVTRTIEKGQNHHYHNYQQLQPQLAPTLSRKDSYSSSSYAAPSLVGSTRSCHPYQPAYPPQQQQHLHPSAAAGIMPYESTASGLSTPPWASTSGHSQQQQQRGPHPLVYHAAAASSDALPAYVAEPQPGAPFGQYHRHGKTDGDYDEDAERWHRKLRAAGIEHPLARAASVDSPRGLAFTVKPIGRAEQYHHQGDEHPIQRSNSLTGLADGTTRREGAAFPSWKTHEAFELQAAPAPRTQQQRGRHGRSNSVSSANSMGMRSVAGMGIGLRYVRS